MRVKEEQVIIAKEKITNYLLVKKEKNDKSSFLKGLGYNHKNVEELIRDILKLATMEEIKLSRENVYGSLFKIEGFLRQTRVTTIWFEQVKNQKFYFVTLYPGQSHETI